MGTQIGRDPRGRPPRTAQETSARTLIKIERSTPQIVHSKFLGPAAPGLKQAGPPSARLLRVDDLEDDEG